MKEFKIDTWWKKLLIYVAMIRSVFYLIIALTVSVFALLAGFGLVDSFDDINYSEELSLNDEVLNIEKAGKLCERSCSLRDGDYYEIVEDVEGSYFCDCYDENSELIGTSLIE